MVTLPVFNHLNIEGYELYPSKNVSYSFDTDFKAGVTLIAGVNGLGKTTFVTLLLRMLTGAYDLTGSGYLDSVESTLPEEPRKLSATATRFFAQRVSDDARDSTAVLNLTFAGKEVEIKRSLERLSLLSLTIDGESIQVSSAMKDRESIFQKELCDLFNLSSFVDVLLVIHNVVFFTDKKTGALWDKNAQRQILRTIFLDKEMANDLADAERRFQKADSAFRNTRSIRNKLRIQLEKVEAKQKKLPKVRAELAATLNALAGIEKQIESVEHELTERHSERRLANHDHERAKIVDEEASGAVESNKYKALQNMFPTMQTAAKLHLSRILSDEGCLVCGADALSKKQVLEELLISGSCPACESPPELHNPKVKALDRKVVSMKKAVSRMDSARKELETSLRALEQSNNSYRGAVERLSELKREQAKYYDSESELRDRLPADSQAIQNLKQGVEGLDAQMHKEKLELIKWEKLCHKASRKLRSGVATYQKALSDKFSDHVEGLLAEDAELIVIEEKAKLALYGANPDVSIFSPQMSAASRAGLSIRHTPSDVSESQRELMDLAFRLSIIELISNTEAATLVMETPESSLDGIAMNRVGQALNEFSERNSNRLLVTSNLSNSGMISAIFGGRTKSKSKLKHRKGKVLNLLEEAAVNASLERFRSDYEQLLDECLSGCSLEELRS